MQTLKGSDQLVTDGRSPRLESGTNHRVTPPSWKANDWQKQFSAHNRPTPDGPGDASARYEPAGPTACPQRGGSAVGHPDRLSASDRWLPTQAPTWRVRRHPDLLVLPPHETSRTSPASAGREVPATQGREAASGPSPWRPHAASAVPQADPLPIGPPHRLLRRPRGPPLEFQDPRDPPGLAGVLRVPVPIPSVPASAAPVSPGLRNPGTPPEGGFPLWCITQNNHYQPFIPQLLVTLSPRPFHRPGTGP